MKPYNIETRGTKFALVETKTGFTIRVAGKEAIRKMDKHLNAGGGFNGETPHFFLNRKEQLV